MKIPILILTVVCLQNILLGATFGNFTYEEVDGAITLTDYSGGEADVVIPGEIDGIAVTVLGEHLFDGNEDLVTVVIPEGITTIDEFAFMNCSSLATVSVPSSVGFINRGAFYACSSLESFAIPPGVSSIGMTAFAHCSSLASLTIPDSVTNYEDYAFHDIGVTQFEVTKYVTSIGAGAITGHELTWIEVDPENPEYKSVDGVLYDKSLTQLHQVPSGLEGVFSIPSHVTILQPYAFYSCMKLSEVIIPDSITSIGDSALATCHLERLNIPEGVTSIGRGAFASCFMLQEVSLPSTLETISDMAFIRAQSLTGITLPEGLTSIGRSAFKDSGLTHVTLPASLTDIGDDVFNNCHGLVSISMDSKLNAVGTGWFSNCENLTDIELPDSVDQIGNSAFSGCTSLRHLELPPGLTTIGWFAFEGCIRLDEIKIPPTVTSIGWGAFKLCSDLEEVILPDSVISLGMEAFYDCRNLSSVKISESLTAIEVQTFSFCRNLVSLTVPASVTSIGYQAFYGCYKLESTIFEGDAPSTGGEQVLSNDNPTILYYSGTQGWSDTFAGASTGMLRASGPWRGAVMEDGEWLRSDWFGWLSESSNDGWIYHAEHGWQIVSTNDTIGIYLFDTTMGTWWWTSKEMYPNLYLFGASAGWYLYSTGGSPGERWFYNYESQGWMEEAGIRDA